MGMGLEMDDETETATTDGTSRDGLAAMAILALTVIFIIGVVIALV